MNGFLASLLRSYLQNDRNLDDFTSFESKVKALDTDKVNQALRKYFDKSKLILISAGDFMKKAF